MACYLCLHHVIDLRGIVQHKVRALVLDNNEIIPGVIVRQTATSIVTPNKQSHAKLIIECLIVCSLKQQKIIAVDQSERNLIEIKEVKATRIRMGHPTAKANQLETKATSQLILQDKMYQENHRLKQPMLR